MFKLIKFLIAAYCAFLVASAFAAPAQLTGTVSLNMTSDTAAAAKNIAMDEARRQIITEALTPYTMPDQLVPAVSGASGSDLTNLVATTNISGEKVSDTTYAADISMTLDRGAVYSWLVANGVQNWLNPDTTADMFMVSFTLGDKIADWIQINEIARRENLTLMMRHIAGNQVSIELPAANRAAFTASLRDAGWKTAAVDGVLRAWK